MIKMLVVAFLLLPRVGWSDEQRQTYGHSWSNSRDEHHSYSSDGNHGQTYCNTYRSGDRWYTECHH